MNIFSQSGLFLSDKTGDGSKLHDYYKQNYANHLKAKALSNLRVVSKITNVARKIVNFICMILTFGIKKNVTGNTLTSKQFQVKFVALTHNLLSLENGAINGPWSKRTLGAYDDEAICILINDITETDKIDNILAIIEHPLFDLQRLNKENHVVKLFNKEKNKQAQIDTFNLMMDVANGYFSDCKLQLKNLPDTDQKKLVKYFSQNIDSIDYLKELCKVFPSCKAEILKKTSNNLFIKLMIQLISIEFDAGEYAKVFDKDFIDLEIKRRLANGGFELLVPTQQILDNRQIVDKKTAYQDIQDRILSTFKTVNFKVNLPNKYFHRTTHEYLKKLLVTATLYDYPAPLKLEIYKRLKSLNVDWDKRPTVRLGITEYVREMAGLSHFDSDLINDWVQGAFSVFWNLPEQVDDSDLNLLLFLFNKGEKDKFLIQLDKIMLLYNLNKDLIRHIKQSYTYYHAIKKYYSTIINAWNDQNINERKGIWYVPEINLPLHFEEYNNEKFLRNALDSFLGALEQILTSGIDKDDLKNAFVKGFVPGTNCLEARTRNMEEGYLQHEHGDPDYMPSFDEKRKLIANLTEYMATFRNSAARRYVKDRYQNYPGVDFKSNEWNGEKKLRHTILQSDVFFEEFMTVTKFKDYLIRKEFFQKFLIDTETGERTQVSEQAVDEALQKWVESEILVN